MTDDATTNPRSRQAQQAEIHARRLDLMVRCLSIPLAEDVAAMQAGAAALRQQHETNDQGAHERHGGRGDLGPAAQMEIAWLRAEWSHATGRASAAEHERNRLHDELASLRAAPPTPQACVGCEDGIHAKVQDRILAYLHQEAQAPAFTFDGSGCDSGDPVDLTLDEIGQALRFVKARAERDAQQGAEAIEAARKQGWLDAADWCALHGWPTVARTLRRGVAVESKASPSS